ncbi:MAG: ABC transporter permease, partial [Streptococcus thermophilus]|nr:ABC transporter permease [Streptococcus thermophilus]
MTKTIIRRFLIMIPQLIVLSLFIFFVAQKMPGDPFTGKITPSTGNSKVEEQLKI